MIKIIRLMAGIGCLVFVMLTGCSRFTVQAAENRIGIAGEAERKVPPYILDTQKECTLEIQTEAAQKTAGVRLAVYQVGKIDATRLSLSFVLNEDFDESKADLMAEGNAERRQTIETLCNHISRNQIKPFQMVTLDERGEAELDVPQGAYLICRTEEDETQIQASLVGVPFVSESLTEWQYHMKVQLKVNLGSVPTGDTQNGMVYGGLAMAAVALLAVLIFARKRRKK